MGLLIEFVLLALVMGIKFFLLMSIWNRGNSR